ncbi:uncharacterized protein LOC114340864 [Diabrotica virgifera virgifera]|uniref:Uncharacterized protein n=2 Tax=Diabrotica virgifera virgifera TaxID=50390 RepID=A0ABM5KB82_DIAVI|nr:uncharacterized protein LOC114340864 [Diabrotica virgifera virgifera]
MSMFKSVKVRYPRLKKRTAEQKPVGTPEPRRTTMYDVVLDNFKLASRRTFLHRVIYIGEHNFITPDLLTSVFSETVNKANRNDRLIEKITGLLIRYPKHFIHLLEGDEDVIYSQIGYLLITKAYKKYLGNMKLVTNISHVHSRYANDWLSVSGLTPHLLESLDPDAPIDIYGHYTIILVTKIYKVLKRINKTLCGSICDGTIESGHSEHSLKSSVEQESSYTNQSTRLSIGMSSLYKASISAITSLSGFRSAYYEPLLLRLPELELVNFILGSNYVMNIVDYFNLYGVVPQRDIYKDKIWPIAADFIPYDVFSPIFNMPTSFPKTNAVQTEPTDPEQDIDPTPILREAVLFQDF